jgi:hypothetical protein
MDFYKHDYYAVLEPGAREDKVGHLKAPVIPESGKADHAAALRGIRKNLILLDFFIYHLRFEPFFEKAQAAKQKKGK